MRKLPTLPKLPGYRGRESKELDFDGAKVTVHKARSNRTVPVSSRLLGLLGDEMFELVSYDPDQDEDAGGSGGPLAALLGLDESSSDAIKTTMVASVLPLLRDKFEEINQDAGPGSVYWYFAQLLPGNVILEGHVAQSMEELDEMGFGVIELARLFWAAVELAFFPRRGDPDTSPGPREDGSPKTESSKSPAPGISSFSGESARIAGRRAPTSSMTG